jgi:4-hydroxybenzoate polyprenyltransferase
VRISTTRIKYTLEKFLGFLRLARPANIVTAISDILAGVAIAAALIPHGFKYESVGFLVMATVGLYGGGVVLNDVFDAKLDAIERPERPIPSGLIPLNQAAWFGVVLLILGVSAATFASAYPSGLIALAIALAATVYDKWGKHHDTLGPLNMGLCRGLNLLLGISIAGQGVFELSYIGLVPMIYIAAITMISRGEVHGGKSITMTTALGLYILVMASILYTSFLQHTVLFTALFILAFGLMTIPPLIRAMREPVGRNIGKAVRAGVVGLILMNASWAAAVGSNYSALVILLLLPVSIVLARLFAVT